MKGPSMNQGAPDMNQPTPKWSEKEMGQAREFLRHAQEYSGTFFEKMNPTARALGFSGGYKSMPEGVKAAISHLGAEAKKEAGTTARKNWEENQLDQAEEGWVQELNRNPLFKRDMLDPEIVGEESAERNRDLLTS